MKRRSLLALPILAAPSIAFGQAAATPKVRFAAGVGGGNYTAAAREIAQHLGSSIFPGGVEIFTSETPVSTNGSLANLRLLAGDQADIAFAQSDVLGAFLAENPEVSDRITVVDGGLYKEYIHLLVPRATGWTRINHLGKEAPASGIIVGPDGTGTAETWRILRKADPKLYDNVRRVPTAPSREALGQVAAPDSKTGMLWISGLNAPLMRQANTLSVAADPKKPSLALADFNDGDMIGLVGGDKKKLYSRETIRRTDQLYPNLMASSSLDVLAVQAVLLMSSRFRQSLRQAQVDRFLQAVDDAGPTIRNRVQPPV